MATNITPARLLPFHADEAFLTALRLGRIEAQYDMQYQHVDRLGAQYRGSDVEVAFDVEEDCFVIRPGGFYKFRCNRADLDGISSMHKTRVPENATCTITIQTIAHRRINPGTFHGTALLRSGFAGVNLVAATDDTNYTDVDDKYDALLSNTGEVNSVWKSCPVPQLYTMVEIPFEGAGLDSIRVVFPVYFDKREPQQPMKDTSVITTTTGSTVTRTTADKYKTQDGTVAAWFKTLDEHFAQGSGGKRKRETVSDNVTELTLKHPVYDYKTWTSLFNHVTTITGKKMDAGTFYAEVVKKQPPGEETALTCALHALHIGTSREPTGSDILFAELCGMKETRKETAQTTYGAIQDWITRTTVTTTNKVISTSDVHSVQLRIDTYENTATWADITMSNNRRKLEPRDVFDDKSSIYLIDPLTAQEVTNVLSPPSPLPSFVSSAAAPGSAALATGAGAAAAVSTGTGAAAAVSTGAGAALPPSERFKREGKGEGNGLPQAGPTTDWSKYIYIGLVSITRAYTTFWRVHARNPCVNKITQVEPTSHEHGTCSQLANMLYWPNSRINATWFNAFDVTVWNALSEVQRVSTIERIQEAAG